MIFGDFCWESQNISPEREREMLCLNKIFPHLETGGNLADQPNHKLPGITVIRLSLGITV